MNLLPLYPNDVFGFPTGLLLGTLVGFAFGFVLERAGFGNAKNLAAQFYLTDTRVLKVMFSAIATACAGICPLRPICAKMSGMSRSRNASALTPQASQRHEKISDSARAQRRVMMEPTPIEMNHAARNP